MMASACIDCPSSPPNFTSFSWLTPPTKTISFPVTSGSESDSDPTNTTSISEFEFQLEGGADVTTMLPADELFSDGKISVHHHHQQLPPPEEVEETRIRGLRRNEPPTGSGSGSGPMNDPSARKEAPTCSSRWKDLLGFKRFYHNTTTSSNAIHNAKPAAAAAKSLKSFILHRNQKSSSLTLPLIQQQQDDANDSSSILSSRLSLSSSSSSSGGHHYDDFPRHSLDSDNPNFRRISNFSHCHQRSRRLQGVSKEKSLRKDAELISADSPRMNSSGKIVFHSLERSSSSPSTLNGGPRYKHRGMERSYSANVRYTPVLNVPVCSLRGSSSTSSKSGGLFGFPLFSPTTSSASAASADGLHIVNRKNRSDRG